MSMPPSCSIMNCVRVPLPPRNSGFCSVETALVVEEKAHLVRSDQASSEKPSSPIREVIRSNMGAMVEELTNRHFSCPLGSRREDPCP